MNKKGQVLVMFILLIPVLFLGIYLIYLKLDLYQEKTNQEKLIDDLCSYYYKHKDIDKVLSLGTKMDDTQLIEVKEVDDTIEITMYKEKELINKKNKIKTVKLCKKG